jgi:tetratricopeptide (TPR) repeat protein
MTETSSGLCDDNTIQRILTAAQTDSQRGIEMIDALLGKFPDDPRLHFLRGSLLIEVQRFIQAHGALSRALAIAPDYHIARFQLGLFELTSGESDAASATWAPLKRLPRGNVLSIFVDGLEHLMADRFERCIASLREGIAANDENLPLNRDMELVIEQCEALIAARPPEREEANPADAISVTSFLLRGLKD